MINIKKYSLLIITLFTLHSVVFATGPSWIESKIRPISINENGEILCRTRFSKNEMGAQKAMKVVYGYCVITADTIIQFKTQEIEPDGYPVQNLNTFNQTIEFWDSIFYSPFNIDNLSEIEYRIKNHYNFNSSNISSYKVDRISKIKEIEDDKNITLETNPQKALNGAISTDYYKGKTIHILYDFGNILILRNESTMEDAEIGAAFNYYNPWIDENGNEQNIGYDISFINGVLTIN